ncbi:hypothetical protein WDU94_007014, partial [Cyamophila willieti]
MITLGSVKHNSKRLNDTMEYLANDSGNLDLDLDGLERFLHIKMPEMTKPLIYYRTNNDTKNKINQTTNSNNQTNPNNTSGNTGEYQTSTNITEEETEMEKLKDKGREKPFQCVNKCPKTLVSIEMDIEGERILCT